MTPVSSASIKAAGKGGQAANAEAEEDEDEVQIGLFSSLSHFFFKFFALPNLFSSLTKLLL